MSALTAPRSSPRFPDGPHAPITPGRQPPSVTGTPRRLPSLRLRFSFPPGSCPACALIVLYLSWVCSPSDLTKMEVLTTGTAKTERLQRVMQPSSFRSTSAEPAALPFRLPRGPFRPYTPLSLYLGGDADHTVAGPWISGVVADTGGSQRGGRGGPTRPDRHVLSCADDRRLGAPNTNRNQHKPKHFVLVSLGHTTPVHLFSVCYLGPAAPYSTGGLIPSRRRSCGTRTKVRRENRRSTTWQRYAPPLDAQIGALVGRDSATAGARLPTSQAVWKCATVKKDPTEPSSRSSQDKDPTETPSNQKPILSSFFVPKGT